MKWAILFLTGLAAVSGCVGNKPSDDNEPSVFTGNFYSPRIVRELNYYVAHNSSYPTNHFCVVATELDHTNMVSGFVFWEEDQLLVDYDELVTDAIHDGWAWPDRGWKLGRDTVKTEDEINGSDYLITDSDWHHWVNQCTRKGKRYVVLKGDAMRMFPDAASLR
jgi:hypothetical protein